MRHLIRFIVVFSASCASTQGSTTRHPASNESRKIYENCTEFIYKFLKSPLGVREGGALNLFVDSVLNNGPNPIIDAFPVLNRDYVSGDRRAILRVSVLKSDRTDSITSTIVNVKLGQGATSESHTFEIDPLKEGARILNDESRTVRVITSSDGVCEISNDACALQVLKAGKGVQDRSVVLTIAGREPLAVSGLTLQPTTATEKVFAALVDLWGHEGSREFKGVWFVDRNPQVQSVHVLRTVDTHLHKVTFKFSETGNYDKEGISLDFDRFAKELEHYQTRILDILQGKQNDSFELARWSHKGDGSTHKLVYGTFRGHRGLFSVLYPDFGNASYLLLMPAQ